jgi:hypothetical protein
MAKHFQKTLMERQKVEESLFQKSLMERQKVEESLLPFAFVSSSFGDKRQIEEYLSKIL